MTTSSDGQKSHRVRLAVVGIGCGILLLILNTVAVYRTVTSRSAIILLDFHPTLVAGRAVAAGLDPYSDAVAEQTRREMFGENSERIKEAQDSYVYPAYVAYLAVPLSLLPLPWSEAVWLTLLEFLVVAGILLILQIAGWHPHKLALAGILVWSIGFYPVLSGFFLGQITLLVFTLIVFAIWAILKDHDNLAGIALGLTILKPQVVILFLPAVLFWAAINRRWRILLAALLTGLALLALPTIFQPIWIANFLHRLADPSQYTLAPVIEVVLDQCCQPAKPWLLPLTFAAAAGAVIFAWWAALHSAQKADFLWAAGATLIVTMAVAPRMSIINQIILLLPVWLLVRALLGWKWAGGGLILVLLIVWGGGMWYLTTVPPVAGAIPGYIPIHQVITPILPLSLGLAWLFGRKLILRSLKDPSPVIAVIQAG